MLAESRQALAWIQAHPGRKKTARGMPAFLVGWFGRSVNRGGARRESGIGIQGVDVGPSAEMRRNMERYADLNATPMTPQEVEAAKQALAGKPAAWRNGGTA